MILKTDGSLQNNNGSNVFPMSRKVVVANPTPATFFTALTITSEAVIDPSGESHDPPAVILCGPILDDGSGKNAAGFSATVTTPDALAAGYQPKQAPAAPSALADTSQADLGQSLQPADPALSAAQAAATDAAGMPQRLAAAAAQQATMVAQFGPEAPTA